MTRELKNGVSLYPLRTLLALTGENEEALKALRRRGQVPMVGFNAAAGRHNTPEEDERRGYTEEMIFGVAVQRVLRVEQEIPPGRAAQIAGLAAYHAPFERLVPGFTEGPDVFLAAVAEDERGVPQVKVDTLEELQKFIAAKTTSVVLVNLHRVMAQIRARAKDTGIDISALWVERALWAHQGPRGKQFRAQQSELRRRSQKKGRA